MHWFRKQSKDGMAVRMHWFRKQSEDGMAWSCLRSLEMEMRAAAHSNYLLDIFL
jgi:hypothetical protein